MLLIRSACTSLFHSLELLTFLIISLIWLSSPIVKKLLVISSTINCVADKVMSLNWANSSKSICCINLGYDTCVSSSHVTFRWHNILVNVAKNLVNFTHILVLHLSIQFTATDSTIHCRILVDYLMRIVFFSILRRRLSNLNLVSIFTSRMCLNYFFRSGSVRWCRISTTFFVYIYIIFIYEKHWLVLLLRLFFLADYVWSLWWRSNYFINIQLILVTLWILRLTLSSCTWDSSLFELLLI